MRIKEKQYLSKEYLQEYILKIAASNLNIKTRKVGKMNNRKIDERHKISRNSY